MRVFYWNGYYIEDAPGYVTDAIWLAVGNYHARQYVNGLNVGTYLPVAFPIWLFGKSEVGLSLWPMACSLIGVLSLGGFSHILLGRPFGLLAAFLYATYPGDVFFSTVVMPDSLQAGWLSLSLFLVALSCVSASPQRRRWLLFGGGVAMGVCHLIRANGVTLLPVGLCAAGVLQMVWKREAVRPMALGCGLYAAGFITVSAVEGLAYLWAVQDFFHRFHVVDRHYGTMASIAQAGLNTDPRTIPFSIFAPAMWWMWGGWGHLNQDQAYHALLFCWAVVALAAAIGLAALSPRDTATRKHAVAVVMVAAVWLLWPLLYHQFGSQSALGFVPIHRLSRHLVVYAPGAIFAIAAGCFFVTAATGGRTRARRVVACLGLALLGVHLYFNWKGERLAFDAYQSIKGTYIRIRDRLPSDTDTIVGDPGDLCFFDFWLNPPGSERVRMAPFVRYPTCDALQRGVVLTYANPGWEGIGAPVIQETVARLPCLLKPPARWQLLYDGYPEKIYLIHSRVQTP